MLACLHAIGARERFSSPGGPQLTFAMIAVILMEIQELKGSMEKFTVAKNSVDCL